MPQTRHIFWIGCGLFVAWIAFNVIVQPPPWSLVTLFTVEFVTLGVMVFVNRWRRRRVYGGLQRPADVVRPQPLSDVEVEALIGRVDPTPNAAHPLNIEGPFYVEHGCCLSCGVPQAFAPDLFGEDDLHHCYVRRQPQTPDELKRMARVLWAQELGCIRRRPVQ